MTRRVFFSFDLESDLSRVDQIRNELVAADVDQAGFFDPAEYERVMRNDKGTIRRMIRERVAGTSVTLVLIGSDTASRPFVHLGIEESIANRNGFLGIHIHGIDDQDGECSYSGPRPILPAEVEFQSYIWDWDLENLRREIEAAGRRADRWRAERPVGSRG